MNGRRYDPANVEHGPETILAWHWVRQELQARRADENRHTPEQLPANVYELRPNRRPAHALTRALYERLERGDSEGFL